MSFVKPEWHATRPFSRRRLLGTAAGLAAAAGLSKLAPLPRSARGAQPTPANAILCYFNYPTQGWYTSVDDGVSFQLLNAAPLPSPSMKQNGMAVYPGDVWFLVVGTPNQPYGISIMSSSDQGTTWTTVNTIPNVVGGLGNWCWLDTDVQVLYSFALLSTQGQSSVFSSSDKFQTYNTFSFPGALNDAGPNSLARDPSNGRFMSLYNSAPTISDNGGATWVIENCPPAGCANPNAISMMFNPGPNNPTGISGKTIYAGSEDGAGPWAPIFTSGLPGTSVNGFIVSAPFVGQKPARKTLALWLDSSFASWKAVQTTDGSTWADLGVTDIVTGDLKPMTGFWQVPSGNWLVLKGGPPSGGLLRSTDGLLWTASTTPGGGLGGIMTWPCLTSTVIPFAAFSVQVDIVSSAQAFDARATFTLGQGGTFDLATDAVTIQLSHPPHTAPVTIPKGSFQQVQGRYIFAGVIN